MGNTAAMAMNADISQQIERKRAQKTKRDRGKCESCRHMYFCDNKPAGCVDYIRWDDDDEEY